MTERAEIFKRHNKNFPQLRGRLYMGKKDKDSKLEAFEPSEIYFYRYILINPIFASTSIMAVKTESFLLDRVRATPNFIVKNGNETHVLWLLGKYIPRPILRSAKTNSYLEEVRHNLFYQAEGGWLESEDFRYQGEYVSGWLCLNPFCIYNEVEYLTDKRYKLKELKAKSYSWGGKEGEAIGRANSHKSRKANSRNKICEGIQELIALGMPVAQISQRRVAEHIKMSKTTINEHWRYEGIQNILSGMVERNK